MPVRFTRPILRTGDMTVDTIALLIVHAPQYITLAIAIATLIAVVRDLMVRIDELEGKLDRVLEKRLKRANIEEIEP